MDTKRQKIGILGGIGPEATGDFYLRLITRFQEEGLIKSNKDFPQIIINSIPAPELVFENISKNDLKEYIKGIKELEGFGVDFIVMVCNTIHIYIEELQKHTKTPIICIRRQVEKYLKRFKITPVTVLGTPITIKGGLYKFDNIRYLTLNKHDIRELSSAIFNFNRGLEKARQVYFVEKLARKYLKKSEIIILGCSELSVMLRDKNIPKVDPLEVVIDSIIEKYKVSY